MASAAPAAAAAPGAVAPSAPAGSAVATAGRVANAGSAGHDVNAGAARWLSALSTRPDIGRRAGQQLARRELARFIYSEPITTRIGHWLERLLGRIFNAAGQFPGGLWTIVALLVALVLVVAVVTYWIRPAGPDRHGHGAVLADSELSARDHREAAERNAASGDYAAAIIERMRAIAVGIEERGILPPRPGRTAAELAAQAGRVLPELAADLAVAALLFDDVRYGGRDGTAAGYQRVRELDARVQAARVASSGLAEPALAETGAAAGLASQR
jgi:hypothetical protein